MTILHFSTADGPGGAWRAAYWLHAALRNAGADSKLLVLTKHSDDDDVREVEGRFAPRVAARARRALPLPRQPRPGYVYDQDRPVIALRSVFDMVPGPVRALYLHWIAGFLTVRQIRTLWEHFDCPVVWVLHDQAPLTGGCHYSFGCTRFTESCGRCPQLGSRREHDRSRTVWDRKREALADVPIYFVAPSSWAAERARESSLLGDHPLDFIPLALDTQTFRPFDRRTARSVLRVPADKKVVFVNASYLDDPRKGMDHMREALVHLRRRLSDPTGALTDDDVHVVVAGRGSSRYLGTLPFAGQALGFLEDVVSIALAYQAADIFVCPSIVDSAPLVIPEALLCGTPVVAFDTANAPDLITHLYNGYLAVPGDSEDLARGMLALLTEPDPSTLSKAATEAALRLHSPAGVAARHLALQRPHS